MERRTFEGKTYEWKDACIAFHGSSMCKECPHARECCLTTSDFGWQPIDPRILALEEEKRVLWELLKETEYLFDVVRSVHPGHPAYELGFVDRNNYDEWCKKRRAALEGKEP